MRCPACGEDPQDNYEICLECARLYEEILEYEHIKDWEIIHDAN